MTIPLPSFLHQWEANPHLQHFTVNRWLNGSSALPTELPGHVLPVFPGCLSLVLKWVWRLQGLFLLDEHLSPSLICDALELDSEEPHGPEFVLDHAAASVGESDTPTKLSRRMRVPQSDIPGFGLLPGWKLAGLRKDVHIQASRHLIHAVLTVLKMLGLILWDALAVVTACGMVWNMCEDLDHAVLIGAPDRI